MLTQQELTEIVEPLKLMTDLQVYLKLDELKLPPGARDRVLRELANRRRSALVDRVLTQGNNDVPSEARGDALLDAIFGLQGEVKP
ncbi:MAG: hypothetical protein WEF50_11165 [Myxococcota bacterium]